MRQYDPNNDVEFSNMGVGSMSERQVAESTCPLLGGVVDTAWGAVSAGNLIAGIATGAQPQVVNIMQLVRDASPVNYRNVQQTVNSLFPATLSGEYCLLKCRILSKIIIEFSFFFVKQCYT